MSRKFLTQILLPNDPQQAMEAATKQYVDNVSAAGVPPGVVQMYTGATPPAGWLFCNGDPIPAGNTTLIAMVGANTPDYRGRMPVGVGTFATLLQTDTTNNEANRTPVHSHPISQQADHSHGGSPYNVSSTGHQIVSTTAVGGSAARVFQIGGSGDTNHTHNISGQGGLSGAHAHGGNTDLSGRNQLPYFGINFIIKT